MKPSAFRAAVILGLAAACDDGSGSGSGDRAAPSVALTFPPPVSATDAESVTVTGTASDPAGVAEVRVNGVLGSSSDGFATWQARVSLQPGRNVLTVEVSDSLGNIDASAAQVRIDSQALLLDPIGIAVDPRRQVAFVLDGPSAGVKAVDLSSGLRTTLSDRTHGRGPEFSGACAIALAGQRALVLERSAPESVIAVDLVSGDREILSGASRGTGPSLDSPLAIAVDRERAVVTSDRLQAIVAVHLGNGDRTILSGPSLGLGPMFQNPVGIVMDGARALVLDGFLRAVLAVDLATGDRTVLSDVTTGTGPIFSQYPLGITVASGRALVADPGGWWRGESEPGAVFTVDLLSGDRLILSAPFGAPAGAQGEPSPTAIALDVTDGTRALVADPYVEAILAVDLESGERTVVSPPTSVGTGPSFLGGPLALADGSLLAGGSEAFLVAVDLASGDRTIVSDAATGNGPEFAGVRDLVVDGGRALVLATHAGRPSDVAIVAVDLASGDRSVVSDSLTGSGPAFSSAGDLAVSGSRAFVTERQAVLAVDLARGDRTIVSDSTRGRGPSFWSLSGIALAGHRALVVDNNDSLGRVLEVDLASGDRTIVSDADIGGGPPLKDLTDLVLAGERVLVTRSPGASLYSMDLATGERAILSDDMTGGGPRLVSPTAIVGDGDRVWVTDSHLVAVLTVDVRRGQRAIVAR